MAGVYLQGGGGGALAILFDVLVPSWKFIKPYIIYIQLGLPLPPLFLDNLTLSPPSLKKFVNTSLNGTYVGVSHMYDKAYSANAYIRTYVTHCCSVHTSEWPASSRHFGCYVQMFVIVQVSMYLHTYAFVAQVMIMCVRMYVYMRVCNVMCKHTYFAMNQSVYILCVWTCVYNVCVIACYVVL